MSQSNYQIYSSSKEAWDAMYQAILVAEKSIYWELYIFLDDEAGNPFFDLLEKKAQAGLDVKIVVDSLGSFWLSKRRIKALRDAGVDIRFFHERKRRYRGWWSRLWKRTHRKILAIDEKVGFIGGVNIQKDMKDWLDIHIRLEGEIVHSLSRAFAKSYIICGGEKKNVCRLLKYKFRLLHDRAEIILDSPNGRKSLARTKYVDALLKARERVVLFSPYYYPDRKFLWALWKAQKNGVKVDLLIPFRTDIKFMTYLTYTWFTILQKTGVNVHLVDKMFHAKGVIADDKWAMVGSSNIEKTSFYDNYEANVSLKEKMVVMNLREIIDGWIKKSINLKDINWGKRSRWQRTKEWIALKLYKIWHKDW